MKNDKQIIKFNAGNDIDREKLKYIKEMLLELKSMTNGMELETLSYLLEMSVLEAKLQIEISDYC